MRTVLVIFLFIFSFTESRAQLIINEVMPSNATSFSDQDGDFSDWIELFNDGSNPVDLTGYFLSDDLRELNKWEFPNSTIDAGEFKVIWASGKDIANNNGELHTNFKLKASGETLYLVMPDGATILDQITMPSLPLDISIGRKPGNGLNWYVFDNPTPGSANTSNSFSGVAQSPVLSHSCGFYQNPITLELVKENNSDQIFYTLDGSMPDNQSSLYSAPILIGQTTPVRIKVYRNGALPSQVYTHTYFFEDDLSLSVISLVTAHNNFWGSTGIYQNYNSGEERPVHIEYFDQDGTPGFSLDGGVKIHAPEARTQKSLRLYARPEYGSSKIEYKIFQDKEIVDFECLILRNGGNDGAQLNKTQIRDVYTHKIFQNLDPGYATSAYRPVHVFINGDYWGIYDLRERQDEDYIRENFGYEKEEIDFLEYDYAEPGYKKTIAGDWNDFENLKSFVINNDLSVASNYNRMKDWMDLDNFIDYQITEILIGNQDWCNNNIKFWRPKASGGKWKWVLWDTEYGLGTFSSHDVGKPDFNFFHMAMTWCGWGNGDYTWLLRKLMANEEFKWQYISRSLDLLNSGLKPSYAINFFDELAEGIAPDMQKQFDRWGSNNTIWTNDLNYTRNFITQRPDHYLRHIANEFDFGPAFHELSVDVSDPAKGWVKINTILISKNTPGIDPSPYPWSGRYFGAIPVHAEAIARPGYHFVRWEGICNSSDPEITFQLSGDGSLTAVFEPGGSTGFGDMEDNGEWLLNIYPVPAKDHINIQINNPESQSCIILITDIAGKRIYQQEINPSFDDKLIVDLTGFSKGLYVLTVKYSSGLISTKKFVVN